ncbi:hypothetical protein CHUAL_003597 [Chamberlinius hualienensis]
MDFLKIERFYSIDSDFCQNVLYPLAADMEFYAYVRRGTKMKISMDKMKEVRTLLNYRAHFQKSFNTPNLDHIGYCIETIHGKVYVSTAPLASLTCTQFRDLRLEMSNRGFYVVARVIEQPYGFLNFTLGIEDENGDVIMLELVNVPTTEIPQVGHVIVIKEPYYKLTTRELPAIRCDSPTDITILRRNHPLYREVETIQWKNEIYGATIVDLSLSKTANEWLEEGVKFSKCEINMTHALDCFLAGLSECKTQGDEWVCLKRHVYLMYHNNRYFEKAEECALDIRNELPACTEALLFLIQARFNLEKYDEAYRFARKYSKSLKHESSYMKYIKRVHDEYRNIALASENANRKDMRCFESTSNSLQLNKKRNVVAEVKIAQNELIIAAQPFFVQYTKHPYKLFYNYRNVSETEGSWFLIRNMMITIYKNPNTYFKRIFGFRSSVPNEESLPKMYCGENSSELTIDVERIKDICRINTFAVVEDDCDGVVGLYDYPSHLKHSCHPNASYEFNDGVMLVKTLKVINKNQLVTIDYAQFETDPQKRRELLSRRLIMCNCQKCYPMTMNA